MIRVESTAILAAISMMAVFATGSLATAQTPAGAGEVERRCGSDPLVGCQPSASRRLASEDARITADLRTLFAQAPYLLGGGALQVVTTDAVVELSGIVDTPLEKAEVESMAHRVRGVKSVSNGVAVNNS